MPFPVLFAVLCGMKTNSKGKIMKMNISVNLALVPLSVLTYRNLKIVSFRKKSRATMFLTLLFTSVAITGLVLLMYVPGAGSEAGLIHYAAGLILSASCFLHILKRRKILLNVMNRRK